MRSEKEIASDQYIGKHLRIRDAAIFLPFVCLFCHFSLDEGKLVLLVLYNVDGVSSPGFHAAILFAVFLRITHGGLSER